MIYIVSDHHFYHENIIGFSDRPYSDVHQMNKSMIDKWNHIIKDNDLVIHLGDFSFASFDITANVLSLLKGHKILVKGNHDRSSGWMRRIGFDRVYKSLSFQNTRYGKLLMIHDPSKAVGVEEKYDFVLHGHTHLIDVKNEKYINCCVEKTNYEPVAIKQLIDGAKNNGTVQNS